MASNSDWKLYYWPLTNRGNFIRLILEESGVDYEWINDPQVLQSLTLSPRNAQGRKWPKNKLSLNLPNNEFMPMAPPFLINKSNNFCISQTANIVSYLSNKFNVRPISDEDNAKANMIVANCNEMLGNISGPIFAKVSDDVFIESINKRLDIWLFILNKPLQTNNKSYYFDNKVTQADLAVYNIIDGTRQIYGQSAFNILVADKYPCLYKHYKNMLNNKSVKKIRKENKSFWPKYFKKAMENAVNKACKLKSKL